MFDLPAILATLTEADVEWLTEHGTARSLRAGDQVVSRGELQPHVRPAGPVRRVRYPALVDGVPLPWVGHAPHALG